MREKKTHNRTQIESRKNPTNSTHIENKKLFGETY